VFLCSSDNRADVLLRTLPSYLKFWPDNPYRFYVGCNSERELPSRFTVLPARPSEWRQEFLEQLDQMPEERLILFLDDYLLLAPVDQGRVAGCVAAAEGHRLPYLRLLPLRKSVFRRISASISRTAPADIEPIPENRPFISGLQVAVWDKAYLCAMLKTPGSIWEFEHRQMAGRAHCAITRSPPIAYSHLVEKGRWLPYAPRLLMSAGFATDLGARPKWPAWMHLRLFWDELRFQIQGYANH
jgi:hypothetical protein